jgi:hypothetical protein
MPAAVFGPYDFLNFNGKSCAIGRLLQHIGLHYHPIHSIELQRLALSCERPENGLSLIVMFAAAG